LPRKLVIGGVEISRRGRVGIATRYGQLLVCIDPGEEVANCDYTLCTHLHVNHCVEPVVRHGRNVFSPLLNEVKSGSTFKLGDLEVEVVDAYNKPELYAGSPPHPKGVGVGYVLLFPTGFRLYYMGDTNFVDELAHVNGGLTVLVLPIGGGCVMTPEEAFEAVKTLRPVVTIPVHWDNVKLFHKFRDLSQPYTQVIRVD